MKWESSGRKQHSLPSARIYWLYAVVFIGVLTILGRLYLYQVVYGEDFRGDAKEQYISSSQAFGRGSIYFTEKDGGRFGASVVSYGFFLYIDPKTLQDPESAYEKLSDIIEIDRIDFLQSAKKKDDTYEKIADRISEEDAKKISALDIPGVRLHKDSWRFYPGQATASHLLGYYGYNINGVLSGVYGLEEKYNEVLTPDQNFLNINIFAEIFGEIASTKEEGNSMSSEYGDIYTTIEPTVQSVFEKNLRQAKEKWNAESVGGIVMNPKTGAIYAMASLPEFNPNTYWKSEVSTYNNPLVGSIFEMGSIIKAITMASALDSEAVSTATTYFDTGTRVIGGMRIANYDFLARGKTSMQEILNHSLNLGAVFLMEEMGEEAFSKYFRDFGLNEKTGIDLPAEIDSMLRLKNRRKIGYATASFGQGIALTPIATIRALSALGNGGTLPNPHLVWKIDYKDKPTWEWQAGGDETRVISPQTSETITRMLVEVMDDHVLGGSMRLEHYSIASKTGTAQVVKPSGGYYEDRYFHTFFGYYPAYDPKFIVLLYMKHPKDVLYAVETLSKPFVDTAQFLLNYYDVPPDR